MLITTCLSGITTAQISMSQFLATAKTGEAVLMEQRKLDFLRNTSHELPWVDQLEFRTETNDFLLKEQEYLLRVSPNSPAEHRAQNRYHQANISLQERNREMVFAEGLRLRYNLIASQLYLQQLLPLQEKLHTLYRDRLRVLQSEAIEALTDGDLRDMAETDADIQELELEMMETRRLLEAARYRTTRLAAGADSVLCDPAIAISVDQMAAMVLEWKPDTTDTHLLLARRKAQIELSGRAYDRELASTRRIVDFMQVRYGGRNNELFQELLSIGLGFRFPVKGDDKIDLNNLKLDRIERENEYHLLKTELREEQEQRAAEIRRLYDQYRQLLRQQKDNQASFILEQYRRSGEARPMTLLALQETILRRDLTLVRLRHRIVENFVDWLDASGKMVAPPLTNYLSGALESF